MLNVTFGLYSWCQDVVLAYCKVLFVICGQCSDFVVVGLKILHVALGCYL